MFPEYKFEDDLPLVLDYLKRNNVDHVDPVGWDKVICELGRKSIPGNNYLVEFARGHDPEYLKQFNISPNQVYERAFSLLLDNLAPEFANSCAIMHLTADFKTRLERNNRRRIETGQDLPNHILKKVFYEETFTPNYIDPKIANPRFAFFSLNKLQIPTATYNNNERFLDNQKDIFSAIAIQIINFFNEYK